MKPRRPEPGDSVLSADRTRALEVTPVSRETLARLDEFVDLLLKWQRRTNLIAPATISEIWTRHVADSLQLVTLAPQARTPQAQTWIDLGSGGGFPGLVIACVLADTAGTQVRLVESNAKKAAFLRETARALGLPALVHAMRIEEFTQSFADSADVVTARALAPLARLLDYAEPLLKSGAQGLFPKGQDVAAELTEASKYWRLETVLVPSKTSTDGRIVVVRRVERRQTGDEGRLAAERT
jgi:16S rRNA (guanine527-N7)-methyltransferase